MKKYFVKGKVLLGTALVAGFMLSGCGDSENFVFTNTAPVVVPAPPVAADDAFNALGNATVTYTAANGVLTNDTVNGANISAFDAVGSNGGTVVLNADGSFTYTPVFGFVGAETFNYTLSNADGDSTATVTMTSTGQGFFVDNTVGTTGNGSQTDPFDALTDAIAVAANGDTIFVSRGDGTSTGLNTNVTLLQGVSLIGEGAGLVLTQTVVPQGQAPVINATVTVSGDNVISGLDFTGTDDAINGDGFSNVTITNNTFSGGLTDQLQVDLDNVLGAITISDNTFNQDSNISSVEINTAGTCAITANANTIQLPTPTADGDDAFNIDVNDGANATVQMNDNGFIGNAAGDLDQFCDFNMFGASQATLTGTGNTASFHDYTFDINLDNSAQLTATFTGNICTDNEGEPEYDIDLNDTSQATIVLDNNSMTNFGDDGVAVDTDDSSSLNLALRNNTISPRTPSPGDPAVVLDADDSSNLCAEITGNTFGGDLRFRDQTSGNYDVEQFGNAMGDVLATLNTFTTGAIFVDTGTVNSVADGACTIP